MGYAFHERAPVASGSPFLFVAHAASGQTGRQAGRMSCGLLRPVLFALPRCLSFLSTAPSLCRDAVTLLPTLLAFAASTCLSFLHLI